MLLAALAGALVHARALHGEFVYDDERQIVANTLIQDPALLGKALSSDVWAFKGAGQGALSNYWRPAFVLWLVLNHRLFGLQSTVGWHALNLALHAAVTALAYLLARRLALSPPVSAAVALLFAVHPAHVESVAWISGSPDLLLGLGLLGALLIGMRRGPLSPVPWAAALLAYALAQLSKEVAILFPGVLAVALVTDAEGEGAARRWWRAARRAAPFAVLGALYLAARVAVLGVLSRRSADAPGLASAVLSAPEIAAFYLRQAFFPVLLGPSYPLRAVRPGDAGFSNVVLPGLLVLAAAAAGLAYARRRRAAAVGLALFGLILAPAFDINAFMDEHLVHDRYLYLPLLGLLLVVVPAAEDLASRLLRSPARAGGAVLAAAAVLAVPLAVQTTRYASAWTSNLALWERGTRVDPDSAFGQSMLGVYLQQAGRMPEARLAFDRSIAITPLAPAYLGRAEVGIEQGRFAEAEADVRRVLRDFPGNFQAWERLALCLERQGRYAEAAQALREARTQVPAKACTLTELLAIVLYEAGRKGEALAELEWARPRLGHELDPTARLVLFRIGLLYAEAGRKDEAAAALREYLDLTRTLQDPETLEARAEAQRVLATVAAGKVSG